MTTAALHGSVDGDVARGDQLAGETFTPEERRVRDRVRAVVRAEVAPRAAAVDRESRFPHQGYQALAAAGLAGLLVPPELGGSGHSMLAYVLAVEEVAAACPSTSTVYMTQMHVAHPLVLAGNEEQQRYVAPVCHGELYGSIAITEPDAGSDAAGLRTRAQRDGDEYVLDGAKTFITTGDRAGVILVFATVDPAAGARGITGFLVEPTDPGFSVGRVLPKMGMRGSSTAELTFSSCRVAGARRIGAEGSGFPLLLATVSTSRLSAAAQGVGIARAAYELVTRRLGTEGLLDPSRREAQDLQFRLADLRTEIATARCLLHQVARQVESAGLRSAEVAGPQVSMAKLRCTDLAMAVATEAVDLLGEDGDLEDLSVERCLRDAKVLQIYDGTNQIQRVLIARDIARGSGSAV